MKNGTGVTKFKVHNTGASMVGTLSMNTNFIDTNGQIGTSTTSDTSTYIDFSTTSEVNTYIHGSKKLSVTSSELGPEVSVTNDLSVGGTITATALISGKMRVESSGFFAQHMGNTSNSDGNDLYINGGNAGTEVDYSSDDRYGGDVYITAGTGRYNWGGQRRELDGEMHLQCRRIYIKNGWGNTVMNMFCGVQNSQGVLDSSSTTFYSPMTVDGNLQVNDNLQVNGNTILGNAQTDTITMKGDVTMYNGATIKNPPGSNLEKGLLRLTATRITADAQDGIFFAVTPKDGTGVFDVLVRDTGSGEVKKADIHDVCFLPGTKITLFDKIRINIENLQKGDSLLSYKLEDMDPLYKSVDVLSWFSEDDTGEFIESIVENIWTDKSPGYIILNDNLHVTHEHLIFTQVDDEFTWLSAKNIRKGDIVFTDKGEYEEIKKIKKVKEEVTVYNLRVRSDAMNYFADSYLVHNASLCDECAGKKGL
tara:strand:- start:17968 stop:19401 length:1434 start_codon:yes stop_codon:yes gene_type:complete